MNIRDWPCWAKVGVGVMLTIFALNWPTSGTEWADWVQAFGSIGAIVAAIYVMSRQAKIQRDLKALEKKETLASAVGLIVRASEHIQTYIEEPDLASEGCQSSSHFIQRERCSFPARCCSRAGLRPASSPAARACAC